jgi:hypothetical protein
MSRQDKVSESPSVVGAAPRSDYLRLDDAALLAQCSVDTFRGSGPGGQKRNKTDSGVRVRHRPSGLSGQATDSRSQHDNRRRALRRLRHELAFGLREDIDLASWRPPDELARLLAPRGERIGLKHRDYLPAIAALLDLFIAHGCALKACAEQLGLSSAALSKLITGDGKLLAKVNQLRSQQGLRALK